MSLIESARPDDRVSVLEILFGHLRQPKRLMRVATFECLFDSGELDPAGLFVASHGGTLRGAILGCVLPGSSGLIWPPGLSAGEPPNTADRLVEHSLNWLRSRGAKLAQSVLASEDLAPAEHLVRNGVQPITRLWMMRHPNDSRLQATVTSILIRPYPECDPNEFRSTLELTYEATLDCPELNGTRSVDEILRGYLDADRAEPRNWFMASIDGRPVGVMILASAKDRESMDLAYLGVVAAARNRGVGRALVRHALRVTIGPVTLVVDARNEPAIRLYRNEGFQFIGRREAFLSVLR